MKKYFDRCIDVELKEILEFMGAVLIVGPKWCGKTTTAKQFAKTIIELQNPDKNMEYFKTVDISPSRLFIEDKPLLLDKWQMAPELWDAVSYDVDNNDDYGSYILTASTVVDESKIMHSGTGRIHRLMMRPMSLYESGDSSGDISLLDLFDNEYLDITGIQCSLTLDDLIHVCCRGGWPETMHINNKDNQLKIAKTYVKSICECDTSIIDGVKRNPKLIEAILKSYSRHISSIAKNTEIMRDIEENYGPISKGTFYSYINVLKNLFIIEEIPAWSPNIKSQQKIRKTAKKEFIDPSIAVASLNISPQLLLKYFETFTFIFKTLCIRDLRIYSSRYEGSILYYKDTCLEVDCVLQLNDGRYALIDFKLGHREIEKAAKDLLKIKNKIIKSNEEGKNIQEPSFLAIITCGIYAFNRKDGVYEIPIGLLR